MTDSLCTTEWLFWLLFAVVIYAYMGYALLLYALAKIFPAAKKKHRAIEPDVTIVVAAYNEEAFIEQKIKNSLSLDYPKDKLTLLFVTDGSTDNTVHLIQQYPQIRLLHQPQRSGKTAALNRAMQQVTSPIVVFTDANTLLNPACLKNMVKHYADETVGGVSGEKKIGKSGTSAATETGERLYWVYESFLKKLESNFYTVVGAAGELFSIRTQLFKPLPEHVLLDDFLISLHICLKGYRVRYEPDAYAIEAASATIMEEQKRRIRISAGGFQAISLLRKLLNPFYHFRLFFQYVSHRVLRWLVCPFLLPLLFIANAGLAIYAPSPLYDVLFSLQAAFYLLATIGWFYAHKNIKVKLLYLPYYFVFMNASQYGGLLRFLKKGQTVLWEKAVRKKLA